MITDWRPQPQQEAFLQLGCFEALYGGAAGGGKTDALLIDLASFVGRGYGKHYQAIFLRRTSPELEMHAIRRAHDIYPALFGGSFSASDNAYYFPQGEVIRFGHCQYEKDVTRYQGSEFQRIAFDELTTFTEYQYRYLFSRVRSAYRVPCGIRGASNPGGVGHEWVLRRFRPWLSKRKQVPLPGGTVRYFVERDGKSIPVPKGTPGALGRTFVPALLSDNKILQQADPDYAFRLDAMDALTAKRLKNGDWDAEPAKCDFWNRTRLQTYRDLLPTSEIAARCRAWDFGATKDGDPTSGVRLALTRTGQVIVEHEIHFAEGPNEVEKRFKDTLEQDAQLDARTVQSIPEDPGAAGKFLVRQFQRDNPRYAIIAQRPHADKITRFRPISSRQLAGNVGIIDNGTWDTERYNSELEAFPEGTHDDSVDATGDAYRGVYRACASDESFETIQLPSR